MKMTRHINLTEDSAIKKVTDDSIKYLDTKLALDGLISYEKSTLVK
jgi:hypothetical protein